MPSARCCPLSFGKMELGHELRYEPRQRFKTISLICETAAGMAQPGKALDCYLLPS